MKLDVTCVDKILSFISNNYTVHFTLHLQLLCIIIIYLFFIIIIVIMPLSRAVYKSARKSFSMNTSTPVQ